MIDDLTEACFDAVLDSDVGLGRPATYTSPDGSVEVGFDGDFDDEGTEIQAPGGDSVLVTTQPKVGVKAGDFSSGHPKQNGRIVFAAWPSRPFLIERVEPAEVGWRDVWLTEA